MKKILVALVLIVTTMASAVTVFCQSAPEAFMGFSVSEDWLVFSRDMTDDDLLKSLDITKDEVNEILDDADCEYFLSNIQKNQRVYLKIENNDLSNEFYNISETDENYLKENAGRILKDGFSVDGFVYNSEDISFSSTSQMKLMTIKGEINSGEGVLLGITFVNGSGIAFIMHTDEITDETVEDFNDIASSMSFTIIREKGGEDEGTGTSQTALKYIAGGLGALLIAALLIYLVDRSKKTERLDEESNTLNGETGSKTPLE